MTQESRQPQAQNVSMSRLMCEGAPALRGDLPGDVKVRCNMCNYYLMTLQPVPGTNLTCKCPSCKRQNWIRVL